jgi:hypothetical protein
MSTMRNMLQRLAVVAAIAVGAVAPVALPAEAAKAGTQTGSSDVAVPADAALSKALAGTWVVGVTQPGFPAIERHLTFGSDGTLVSNDDLQLTPYGVEHFTIAQGNWVRSGGRTIAATIAGQRYDLQGTLLGSFKVRIELELNPFATAWTGRFRIDIIVPGGQVVFSSGGTLNAVRLAVEPL